MIQLIGALLKYYHLTVMVNATSFKHRHIMHKHRQNVTEIGLISADGLEHSHFNLKNVDSTSMKQRLCNTTETIIVSVSIKQCQWSNVVTMSTQCHCSHVNKSRIIVGGVGEPMSFQRRCNVISTLKKNFVS